MTAVKAAKRIGAQGIGGAASRQAHRSRPKGLSYREQREWEGMEAAVQAAEEGLAAAEASLVDPAVATDASELERRLALAEAARAEVERLFARWVELEEKKG